VGRGGGGRSAGEVHRHPRRLRGGDERAAKGYVRDMFLNY
jgi:hypothetical protein